MLKFIILLLYIFHVRNIGNHFRITQPPAASNDTMASKEIAPPVIRTTVSSAGKMTQAGLTGSLTDLHNTVNLGPLPFPEREDTTCTGYTTKSGQSHRSTRSTKAGACTSVSSMYLANSIKFLVCT